MIDAWNTRMLSPYDAIAQASNFFASKGATITAAQPAASTNVASAEEPAQPTVYPPQTELYPAQSVQQTYPPQLHVESYQPQPTSQLYPPQSDVYPPQPSAVMTSTADTHDPPGSTGMPQSTIISSDI
jgi:hypothetical protein